MALLPMTTELRPKVKFPDADKRLYKYRVQLDKIGGEEPTNKDLRRRLIRNLLNLNTPNAEASASDYFSHIVSVGELYDDLNGDNKERSFQHTRPPHGKLPAVTRGMNSTIHFEAEVRLEELQALVKGGVTEVEGEEPYHPDEDLKSLNLLSWARINYNDFNGAHIGKKFYPSEDSLNALLHRSVYNKQERRNYSIDVYEARTGFFSSMRPGNGSLLLNVNVTTSAFFPPINLQDFINKRYGRLPYDPRTSPNVIPREDAS
jgi:eukaryotic translation initiation factor 2C